MTGGEEIPESFIARIAKRMAELWKAGDAASTGELFALAHEAFDLRARLSLARDYRLDIDTVDDCVGDAVEALLKAWRENPGSVRSPYNWLWGVAQNLCKVVVRSAIQRRKDAGEEVEFDDELAGSILPDSVATTWLEELGDMEVDSAAGREWVRDVVLASVNQLTPKLKAVALEMLREDAEALVDSTQAAERLEMTPAAWRQGKKRVMDSLRSSIPEIIAEMGISLTPREEQSLFKHRERHEDARDDEGDGGI